MKRAAAALLLLGLTHGAARAFVIKEFNVKLEPNTADSSFLVTEKITVDYGQEERHGLYREIPVVYNRGGAVVNAGFILRQAASDHSANSNARREGRKVVIKIGDADRTVSGVHAYTIQYAIGYATLFFPDHDEIYWNATGSDWLATIERAEFRLPLPATDRTKDVTVTGYTGPAGTRGKDFTVTNKAGVLIWKTTKPLGPGSGLTIVAGFPKGTFHQPPPRAEEPYDPGQSVWRAFMPDLNFDRTAVGTAVGVFLAAALGLIGLWRHEGQDPEDDLPVPVEFEVPADLSPAEAGTLVDEKADQADVLATLFDMAARGFLRVANKKGEYSFTRLAKQGELRPHETKFMDALFGTGTEATLQDSRERFARSLQGQQDLLYRSMEQKGYFPVRPDVVRTAYMMGGMLGMLGAVGLNILVSGAGHTSAATGVLWGGITASLLFIGCAPIMPKKTLEGARIARRLEGFKEFVNRVEKDRLAALLKKTPDIFEKVLPYAIALGVGREWARRFEGLLVAPPTYYEGDLADFQTSNWYDSMSTGTNRLTFPQRSESSGDYSPSGSDSWSSGSDWGSSSGSSDSGSSGGGGGGGGGGAW